MSTHMEAVSEILALREELKAMVAERDHFRESKHRLEAERDHWRQARADALAVREEGR